MITTWRELLTYELSSNKEGWEDVVAVTPTLDVLDVQFDNGFGGAEGYAFTMWTKSRVYFPHEYDGAESVMSVPRNPCTEAHNHSGDAPEWGQP